MLLRPSITPLLVGAVAILPWLPSSAWAQSWNPGQLRRILELDGNGLKASDWDDVAKGKPAAVTIPTTEDQEVALVGAIRIDSNVSCYLGMLQDIESFKSGDVVVRVKKLPAAGGEPLTAADFAGIDLSSEDLDALENCRVGDCGVKLPKDAIARIAEVAHSSGRQAADRTFRQWLAGYVQRYREKGDAALVTYADHEHPVSLSGQLQAMLNAIPQLKNLAPNFFAYLSGKSLDDAPHLYQFDYWSIENYGLKPVASVTHVMIAQKDGQAIIASKQIYANHYFDGSLGLTFLENVPGPMPESNLIYLNRSRVDVLSGWTGGLRRFFLRHRLLSGVKTNLKMVATRVKMTCGP